MQDRTSFQMGYLAEATARHAQHAVAVTQLHGERSAGGVVVLLTMLPKGHGTNACPSQRQHAAIRHCKLLAQERRASCITPVTGAPTCTSLSRMRRRAAASAASSSASGAAADGPAAAAPPSSMRARLAACWTCKHAQAAAGQDCRMATSHEPG